MPVPSPWNAWAVHHIPRWPAAQLSQHYLGVLFTPAALSGHRHPACFRSLTSTVTGNSASGLIQTTRKYRRPGSCWGRAQMGLSTPGQPPSCTHYAAALSPPDPRAELCSCTALLCRRVRLFWLLEGWTISRLSLNAKSWIRHLSKVYFIKGSVIIGDTLWTVIHEFWSEILI